MLAVLVLVFPVLLYTKGLSKDPTRRSNTLLIVLIFSTNAIFLFIVRVIEGLIATF